MNDIIEDEKKIQKMQINLANRKDSERIHKVLMEISMKNEIYPEDLRVTINSLCADPSVGNIQCARVIARTLECQPYYKYYRGLGK